LFNLNEAVKVHFIGIGGIGMSGIAEILLSLGYKVSGSDMSSSANTEKLKTLGAEVYIGHARENLEEVTVVVYSSAIDDTNPEYKRATEENIPIMRRAEMLAELMRLKKGIAVAGTHGKTTTTSILATILEESRFEPTYVIGGIVENLDGHAKVGKGEFLVAEADESDGSFLLLNPIMSVITNIDFDHLDHYKTKENLIKAFEEFSNKVPFYGCCALNVHDEIVLSLIPKMKKPHLTFGILDEGVSANIGARSIVMSPEGAEFELVIDGRGLGQVKLGLPGRHNILNALGAISMAFAMGVKEDLILSSIQKFKGVGRRLQKLYKKDDFELVDDYGHHPTEIKTTIKTMKDTRPDKEVVVFFEPHRFTRTRDCWNEFLHSFNDADRVFIAPIYPASEKAIEGITTERLIKDINKLHPGLCEEAPSIEKIGDVIEPFLGKKVAFLCLGAGAIGRKAKEWASGRK
jgi:UDP-N-acetylmuramate--alanine ligase